MLAPLETFASVSSFHSWTLDASNRFPLMHQPGGMVDAIEFGESCSARSNLRR
jgi:hypothetical protein